MPHTYLVTGSTGFIARHIIAGLLQRGHTVVGSARSKAGDAKVRAALAPVLDDTDWQDRYRTITLDLSSDEGWDDALVGIDSVFHTASPFPLEQPRNEADLIRPAVDGALRALRSAQKAGVTRVVLTSSSAAITGKPKPGPVMAFDETDWSDVDDATMTPYAKSKTLAERAAWDFAADHPEMQLTAINPSLVLGAPLGDDFGTSVGLIERLMDGRDPMLPRVGFASVDVRDVATAHIRAMEDPATIGKRYPLADRFLWFADLAEAVKRAAPQAKVPTRVAPNVIIRILGLFDRSVSTILPILGKEYALSADAARSDLGIEFRDAFKAAQDTASWMQKRV